MKISKPIILIILTIIFLLIGCMDRSYKIHFETNGGEELSPISYIQGEDVLLPEPLKEDSLFSGWYIDEDFTIKFEDDFSIKGNIILYAQWSSYYDKAIHAIEIVEQTLLLSDFVIAQELITKIPDQSTKMQLESRLDDINETVILIDLSTNAINTIINAQNLNDLDYARELVTLFIDHILEKIDDIEAVFELEELLTRIDQAIKLANSSWEIEDVEAALVLVNQLPNTELKENFITKLATLECKILDNIYLQKAELAITLAESSHLQTDIDQANHWLSLIANENLKTDHVKRLDKLIKDLEYESLIANATESVVKLERSLSQEHLDIALELVNQLDRGELKNILMYRINVVKNRLDLMKQEQDAIEAIEIAETLLTKESINSAINLINNLESICKEDLLHRINKLKDAIDALEKAEDSKSQTDYQEAQLLVNNLEFDELYTRLHYLNLEIQAHKHLLISQTTLLKTDYQQAKNSITQLNDGEYKNDLQTILDTITEIINSDIKFMYDISDNQLKYTFNKPVFYNQTPLLENQNINNKEFITTFLTFGLDIIDMINYENIEIEINSLEIILIFKDDLLNMSDFQILDDNKNGVVRTLVSLNNKLCDEDGKRIEEIELYLKSSVDFYRGKPKYFDDNYTVAISTIIQNETQKSNDIDPIYDNVTPKIEYITYNKVIIHNSDSFVFKIKAYDENLNKLILNIDEYNFTLYANENPYKDSLELYEIHGITVVYKNQEWTIDFGEELTQEFIATKDVIFDIIIKDYVGNQYRNNHQYHFEHWSNNSE